LLKIENNTQKNCTSKRFTIKEFGHPPLKNSSLFALLDKPSLTAVFIYGRPCWTHYLFLPC